VTPAPARRTDALAALRHRNFRLFYGGQVLSLVGTWMQTTALGWLVLELTDSEFLLGLVTAATFFPILIFTLFAGVVADRLDKRRILVVAQAMMCVVALVLAVLTDVGAINVWMILALVLLHGSGNAFEIPTRQSFFVELVGREDLTNAIALNSSAFNLTRIIGPAVAGFLIGAVGIAACFYLNAVSYLFVMGALLAIRRPRPPKRQQQASKWENLKEGLAYLRGDRLCRTLVGMVAMISILGLPYAMLMPVFARDILDVGAQGLGWLLAATGIGAFAGGMALAAHGTRVRRGRLLFTSSVAFCILLAAFALSRSFPLSLVILAGFGFSMILTTATANAIIQSVVPDHLRGRVMAVYVFMFLGLNPVGSLQAGAVAHWTSAPVALALGAALLLVLVLVVWRRNPELREIA
jgi:MFS family permease